MKWAHIVFGVAVFTAFTVTGRYMRIDFPDKDLIPPDLRLLMRSRHIYILFSALIHLSLSAYFRSNAELWRRVFQYAGSGLLFISSFLLIYAFVVETYQLAHFSNLSRYGIYSSLAGVGLHSIAGISSKAGSN